MRGDCSKQPDRRCGKKPKKDAWRPKVLLAVTEHPADQPLISGPIGRLHARPQGLLADLRFILS